VIDQLPFKQIWLADFEFISKAGERPDVVCLCARELRTGQTLRLWRNELGPRPPYSIDDDALFVCYVANAECACHMALGWPLPKKILDLSPMFRCVVNGRETPQGKGLIGALAYFGLDPISARYKDDMRERILQGWPFAFEEREKILDYCLSDTEHLEGLLEKLLPQVELATALHWGEFAAVSAAMEHRGVPIDMDIFPQLADKRAWAFVRDALVPKLDAQYGVYVKGLDGEWHFNSAKFEECCVRLGIDWPRKEDNGKIDLRKKTWESMCKSWPVLDQLRQLRHTRDKMRRIKLAVGDDGRNRTVLWPFQSKTSRSQPKAAEWIFSPAAWLRSLIKPGPGRAIAYLDWSSMEFQIAGVLAGCQPMVDLYASGSPYIEFAKRFDEAPETATKQTHKSVHERYKVGCLGAQYQMQTETLAQRLGVSTFVANEMLSQHRGLFNRFWAWTEDWIAHALDQGSMRTPLGWTCRTGITELNARSIGNFPIQATGADIMRLACVWAHRRGINLCGSVHDALVIEAPVDRIEADVALTQEIMRRAARVVLGSTDPRCELRTDATVVRYPDRYADSRGVQVWTDVLDLLTQYRQSQQLDEEEVAGQCQIGSG
jgi:DNA polymerase family A